MNTIPTETVNWEFKSLLIVSISVSIKYSISNQIFMKL